MNPQNPADIVHNPWKQAQEKGCGRDTEPPQGIAHLHAIPPKKIEDDEADQDADDGRYPLRGRFHDVFPARRLKESVLTMETKTG